MTSVVPTTSLLLVEDDISLGHRLRKELLAEGYKVSLVTSGAEARSAMAGEAFEVIVLDWMLPDTEGVVWLAQQRADGMRLPVLLLTARGEVEDRVSGLDAGADDYLTKPFALAELLARLRVLLRRSDARNERVLRVRGLEIDTLRRHVRVGETTVELTPREYELLAFLAVRAGEAVSRETLAREVWNAANRFTSLDNVIDVHVANLRKKLRTEFGIDPVTTVRGLGFRIDLD